MSAKTEEQQAEHWMNTKWRPLMAIQYMITCLTDFVLFPMLWSFLQYKGNGNVGTAWVPITLQAGGFYHLSMGAIIGISAWGRTKEKTAETAAATTMATMPTPVAPTTGQNG